MPFDVERRDGLLVLTLDTPGAAVNIFNHATADQTLRLMEEVSEGHDRAVVFRTAKQGSFVNGVGLLLSQAIRDFDDVVAGIGPVAAAYRAVRNCPVPTIAVVEGSCWGCGLEFMLNCRHRIAADTADTQFRMTEVADYNDPPVFGATSNLTLELGLPRAIELVVWGQWWSARDALAGELVQRLAPADSVEESVSEFVAAVTAGDIPPATARWRPFEADWETLLAQTRARIDDLPARYQSARRRALDLIETASRAATPNEDIQEHLHFFETTQQAKDAYNFFHIRQAAMCQAAPFDHPLPDPLRLEFRGEDRTGLRDGLVGRGHITGSRVECGDADQRWARFAPVGHPDADEAVAVAPHVMAETPPYPALLLRPGAWPDRRLVELRELERGSLRPLSAYLQRLGYSVAISRGRTTLGTGVLIGRFAAPLVAALMAGERRATIEHTLRTAGWMRRTPELLAGVPADALADVVRPHLPDPTVNGEVKSAIESLAAPARWVESGGRALLIDAVVVALLSGVLESLDGAGFDHPAIVDLVAQEVLDFPVHHKSLCCFLTPDRVRAALREESQLRDLVSEHDLVRAEEFVRADRRLYL